MLARMRSLAVVFTLLPAAMPAAADRVDLTLDPGEADQVLAIVALQAAGRPIPEEAWQRLFATEPYRRLKEREAKIAEQFHVPEIAFEDADFRKFVLSKDLAVRAPLLRATLEEWRGTHLESVAARTLGYLPPEATLRAKIFPVVKPRKNSFVWQAAENPAIFLYIDPEWSRARFENTIAHELHHIGLASAQARYERTIATLPELPRAIAEWVGAFGEGLAMLAAAGGPDADPQAASPAADRERWAHDLAKFDADFAKVNRFFEDVLAGKFADRAAIDAKAADFFGTQGPWYTVGYAMAVRIELRFGRPALIETMLDPRALLERWNEAATESNAAAKGPALPLWSEAVLHAVRAP